MHDHFKRGEWHKLYLIFLWNKLMARVATSYCILRGAINTHHIYYLMRESLTSYFCKSPHQIKYLPLSCKSRSFSIEIRSVFPLWNLSCVNFAFLGVWAVGRKPLKRKNMCSYKVRKIILKVHSIYLPCNEIPWFIPSVNLDWLDIDTVF